MDFTNEKLYPRKRLKGRRGCVGGGKGTQKFHSVYCNLDPYHVEVRKSKNKYHKEGYKSKKKSVESSKEFDDGEMVYDRAYSVKKKKRWELIENLKKGDGLYSVEADEGGKVFFPVGSSSYKEDTLNEIKNKKEEKDESDEDDEYSMENIERKLKGKKISKVKKRRPKAPSRMNELRKAHPNIKKKRGRRNRGAKKTAKYRQKKEDQEKRWKEENNGIENDKDVLIDTALSNEDVYEFNMMKNRKLMFSRQRGNRGYSPEWRLGILKNHHRKRREGIRKDIKSVYDK